MTGLVFAKRPSLEKMFHENVYMPDGFKGCLHDCVYCKPSFQRQAKRQRKRCEKCWSFIPHSHFDRLPKKSPRTIGKQFVFFPKGGDPCFASGLELEILFQYAKDNPQTTFFMSTKNPQFLWHRQLPSNLIVAITLETNCNNFLYHEPKNPSIYDYYSMLSKAPPPTDRYKSFSLVQHPRKAVTIEPILSFSLDRFIEELQLLKPEFVYIGYDNHNCFLPEPTLSETQKLINELTKVIEVRLKTIRKAWYEPKSVLEVSLSK